MLIHDYTDLEISTPDCMPGLTIRTADFKLNVDISFLLPYINADIAKSAYYPGHPCIIFELEGVRWSLYPDRAGGVPFADKEQAECSIQDLIHYLNDLNERKNTIEPSTEAYKHIPVLDLFKCLPGSNCGKCNFTTCMAFAAALSKGEVIPDQCPELEGFNAEKAAKLKEMVP